MVREYDDTSEHNPDDAVLPTAEEAIYRVFEDAQRHIREINVAASSVDADESNRSTSVTFADFA